MTMGSAAALWDAFRTARRDLGQWARNQSWCPKKAVNSRELCRSSVNTLNFNSEFLIVPIYTRTNIDVISPG